MTAQTLQLPQTHDELRDCIQKAIAFYQGNPAKNDNKLNEALAFGLNYDNYDQLATLLDSAPTKPVSTAPIMPYSISLDHRSQQLILNGQRIDMSLVNNGFIPYTVVERTLRIHHVKQLIIAAQADSNRNRIEDIKLYLQGLNTLRASGNNFVLKCHDKEIFICGDTDPAFFNQTCTVICGVARAYYEKEAGELSKTGKKYTNVATYYGGEELDEIYAGELVFIKEDRLHD